MRARPDLLKRPKGAGVDGVVVISVYVDAPSHLPQIGKGTGQRMPFALKDNVDPAADDLQTVDGRDIDDAPQFQVLGNVRDANATRVAGAAVTGRCSTAARSAAAVRSPTGGADSPSTCVAARTAGASATSASATTSPARASACTSGATRIGPLTLTLSPLRGAEGTGGGGVESEEAPLSDHPNSFRGGHLTSHGVTERHAPPRPSGGSKRGIESAIAEQSRAHLSAAAQLVGKLVVSEASILWW